MALTLCRQFSQPVYPCRRFSPLGMELRLFGFGFVVLLVQLAKKVDRCHLMVGGIVGLISQKDNSIVSFLVNNWLRTLYPVWFLAFTWSWCWGWSRWDVLWSWSRSWRLIIVLGITCHNQGTNQLKTNKQTNTQIKLINIPVTCTALYQFKLMVLFLLFSFFQHIMELVKLFLFFLSL